MTGYPRVLVATTTYQGKDYAFEKYIDSIRSIKYPNYKHLMVDTSQGTSYLSTLRRRGVRTLQADAGDDAYEAVTNGYQKIWDYALDNNFDYVLTVESDLYPEPDVIDRLLLHDKEIVGSWYFLGLPHQDEYFQPCIMVDRETEQGMIGSRMLGTKYKLDGGKVISRQEIGRWWKSGLQPCHGCGFGCTLIDTDLMAEIPELDHIDRGGDKQHTDTWFYFQLRNNGIQPFVDTDREVDHDPSPWTDKKTWRKEQKT